MATKKTQSVKSTTLVDLKAELYKKQQEVKAIHRPSANGTRRVSEKTAAIWLAAKKSTRKGRDKSSEVHGLAREPVEDEALNRSRIALEKKAKMYEEMAQGEGLADEELNRHGDLCLVDFDRKLYETVEVCGGETHVKQTPPLGIVPDEEWVEYVDHFGRTRNCHRTDLPEMEEMTRRLKEEEEMRKEEEEGVQGATIEEGPPVVHYQNVQNREARSHGVGYFKFSKDEEQRQEQLSVLNKLRQQVCVHAHTPGLFVSTPIHLDYVCVHTHTPGLCLCPRPHTWTVCVHTHTPGLCLCPHPHTWTVSVSTPTHLDCVLCWI
jgi:hypothetical protein